MSPPVVGLASVFLTARGTPPLPPAPATPRQHRPSRTSSDRERERERERQVPTGRQRANGAPGPISSSMRRSWLYFASRSLRATEPTLICPAPLATARSASVLSSVSPLRAEITAR